MHAHLILYLVPLAFLATPTISAPLRRPSSLDDHYHDLHARGESSANGGPSHYKAATPSARGHTPGDNTDVAGIIAADPTPKVTSSQQQGLLLSAKEEMMKPIGPNSVDYEKIIAQLVTISGASPKAQQLAGYSLKPVIKATARTGKPPSAQPPSRSHWRKGGGREGTPAVMKAMKEAADAEAAAKAATNTRTLRELYKIAEKTNMLDGLKRMGVMFR